MTRHPYGPDELDRHDPALDETARRLEDYASASGGEPPLGLAARVRMAIDAEPPVAVGWWAAFLGWRHGVPARMAAVAGVVVLATPMTTRTTRTTRALAKPLRSPLADRGADANRARDGRAIARRRRRRDPDAERV